MFLIINTLEKVINILESNRLKDYGLTTELYEIKEELERTPYKDLDETWEQVLNLVYDNFLDINNKLYKDSFTDMRLDILCLVCKKDREVLKQLFL